MCGILGVASNFILPEFEDFSSVLNMMAHRGPDGYGEYFSNCKKVVLGHRRLSIVELSDLGRQPMLDDNEDIAIVFNGEIYNHNELRENLISMGYSFHGCSDTEVVLKAYDCWGESFVKHFNGPFAIALFDKKADKLILARDRSGEKPLFYREFNNCLYFSSDLTALAKLCGEKSVFNIQSLSSYLSIGYPLGGNTLIKDCLSLEAGTTAVFDLNSAVLSIEKFWTPAPVASELKSCSAGVLGEELEHLLSDAVRLQLDCDVPACILLSGGVDSSLLTALASQHTNKVKTFTVTFPGHPAFDETDSARLIARHFDTEHTELEGVDVSPDLFLDLANRIDSPVNDSSLIPTFLVNNAVSQQCKVAIGGDGADELFGGYKHYSRMLQVQRYMGSILPFLKVIKANKLKALIPESYRARNWLEVMAHDLEFSIPNIREIFDLRGISSLLRDSHISKSDMHYAGSSFFQYSSGYGSIVKNCCLSDFQTYLRESILVKSDRCSMLNSVEGRAPFLDTRVIDFAFEKVPDCLKTSTDNRKIILKQLSAKLLPESFDLQRKLGFNLPLASMIREGKWQQLVGDVMHSDCDFLAYDYRTNLFKRHMNGENNIDKIFGITLLMIWAKRHNVTLSY